MVTTLNIEITRFFDEAYEYLQNPLNLMDWRGLFEEIHQSESGLQVKTSIGLCDLAFAAPNEYGVLNHVLRDS